MRRPAFLWALAALAGIVLVAGMTLAASRLSTLEVGLSSEPLQAGQALAPTATPAAKPKATATPKPKKKKKRKRPRVVATPPPVAPVPTVVAPPPVTPVPTVDDHGGSGSDDSGGDDRGSGGHGSDD